MSLLIVVPCLNEAPNLPGLLAQLLCENPGTRIVVADGGSRDASREIVRQIAERHSSVTLIDNPDRQQSAGINRAVAQFGSEAEWLLRIDAHCDYPPNYAAALLHAAAAHAASAVVVPMISAGRNCFQRAAAAAQNSRLGTGGSPHRHAGAGMFVDHGHHALMTMALFRQLGGYRSDLTHNEDAELDYRLGQAGARIWLEPDAAVTYFPRSSPATLWRQYWNYGRGRAKTVALHGMTLKWRQRLPLVVPVAAVIAVGALSMAMVLPPLVTALLIAPAAAWMIICLAGGIGVGLRVRQPCAVLAGVAAMIMHLAWGAGFITQRWRTASDPGHERRPLQRRMP